MASVGLRARRGVVAFEPCLHDHDFDYADAFEVPAPPDDPRPAVQFARAGLEGAPALLRALIVLAHRWVLGFHLQVPDEGTVLGWHIATSAPEVAVLEAQSPLLRGVIVVRRHAPGRLRLSTYLYYRRRAPATVLWFAIGPVHRRVAPYLLVRAVTRGVR